MAGSAPSATTVLATSRATTSCRCRIAKFRKSFIKPTNSNGIWEPLTNTPRGGTNAMNLRHLARAIAFGCATLLCGHAEAGSGTFNTLTYNIAGTPTAYNGFSSTNTALISCYVKPFNIVNV